jgi:small-conductance mechanosensitive channel
MRAAATLAASAVTPQEQAQAVNMAMGSADPEDFWDLMFGRHKIRAGLQVQKFFPKPKGGLSAEELDLRNRQLASLQAQRAQRAMETESKIAEREARTKKTVAQTEQYEWSVKESKSLAALTKAHLRAKVAKLKGDIEKQARDHDWGGVNRQAREHWINRQVDGRQKTITQAIKIKQTSLEAWLDKAAQRKKIAGVTDATLGLEQRRKAGLANAPARIKQLNLDIEALRKEDDEIGKYLSDLLMAAGANKRTLFNEIIKAGIGGTVEGEESPGEEAP